MGRNLLLPTESFLMTYYFSLKLVFGSYRFKIHPFYFHESHMYFDKWWKNQFFSFFNTNHVVQGLITYTLEFPIKISSTKYLGVPIFFNSLRISCWKNVSQNISNQLESWDFRSLNMVGHFFLLKYELQGIPIYHIYVLGASKAIYNSIITSFHFFFMESRNGQEMGTSFLGAPSTS